MEMIRSINSNSLASYVVVHSGHHANKISDFETYSSYWGSNCTVILLYGARVTSSLLGTHRLVDWTAVPDLWHSAWGSLLGSRTSGVLT